MAVRFYCKSCIDYRPVNIGDLKTDELNPDDAWADIVCQKCHLVIVTISVKPEDAGKYEFARIANGRH